MRRGVRAVEATCKEGSGSHVMGSRMMSIEPVMPIMNISMVCVVLKMMASKGEREREKCEMYEREREVCVREREMRGR